MKTKVITLYNFEELSETAQQKAIEKLYDINVDYEWWNSEYESFDTLCNLIGVELSNKARKEGTYTPEIYFDLNNGCSSFGANVNTEKLLNAVKDQTWKTEFPTLELDLPKVPKNIDRVFRFLDYSCIISTANRESSIRVDSDIYIAEYGTCVNYNNVESVITELESFIDDVAKELNHKLLTWLQKEYDYLTSKEAIVETIEANSYTFTEDGTLEN